MFAVSSAVREPRMESQGSEQDAVADPPGALTQRAEDLAAAPEAAYVCRRMPCLVLILCVSPRRPENRRPPKRMTYAGRVLSFASVLRPTGSTTPMLYKPFKYCGSASTR